MVTGRARASIRRRSPSSAGIRKRYTDEQILDQLRDCASARALPTMREFERHDGTTVHPQTVIERFGSWNGAKREAGLVPRRFATKDELLQCLRLLGDRIGREDVEGHRRAPWARSSKSLFYWHTFGSLRTALREAGSDALVGEERLDRAIDQGVVRRRHPGLALS